MSARCAVLGDPVAHSLSPALHRAGYDVLGLEQRYDAIRVPGGTLAEFLDERSADPDWRGFSVTAPLKREALEYADEVSDRAALAGGANTLVRTDGGYRADNTDLPGAVAAIRERFSGPIGSGTVIGGGATAASTGLALAELGAKEIRLVVRSLTRAADAAIAVRRHPAAPHVTIQTLDEFLDGAEAGAEAGDVIGDVVVSTVPAAAQSAAIVAALADTPVLFDVIYDPWPTPAAAAVAARGGVVVGGLDLLVHQAVLQFEAFTGADAPLAAMRQAGEAALAARVADRMAGRVR